jgi:hypothetical protein
MTDGVPDPHGPAVAAAEDLYRGILFTDQWVPNKNRPSSAAFDREIFSVDVVSLTGSPQETLGRFKPGTGLVKFNCGVARSLDFHTHLEPDELFPDNRAHAHVYHFAVPSARKRLARALAKQHCETIQIPDLDVLRGYF